jgi:hypothetical protein
MQLRTRRKNRSYKSLKPGMLTITVLSGNKQQFKFFKVQNQEKKQKKCWFSTRL